MSQALLSIKKQENLTMKEEGTWSNNSLSGTAKLWIPFLPIPLYSLFIPTTSVTRGAKEEEESRTKFGIPVTKVTLVNQIKTCFQRTEREGNLPCQAPIALNESCFENLRLMIHHIILFYTGIDLSYINYNCSRHMQAKC